MAADVKRYDWVTIRRHRSLILSHLGVKPFDIVQRRQLVDQATTYARRQMNPVAIFRSTANYVRAHRIEVPTYAALTSVVTQTFRLIKPKQSISYASF